MKPINYYTTLSQEASEDLARLDNRSKLGLAVGLIICNLEPIEPRCDQLNVNTVLEIADLNFNQALGLVKALCDQCQETLISK